MGLSTPAADVEQGGKIVDMHRIFGVNIYKEVTYMTNYREILRLYSLGLNETEIATSCRCTRNTVATTPRKAANYGLQWLLPEDLSDKQLSERLFPSSASKPFCKMLDSAYIHKELHSKPALTGILRLVPDNWRDPVSIYPVQQILRRLPCKNQHHHAPEPQAR